MNMVAPIHLGILALLIPPPSQARDIHFAPASIPGYQYQSPLNTHEPDLLGDTLFRGLTTYANLAYVPCMTNDSLVEKFDIAFLGAPFDTAVTARPGARYGPTAIRLGSRRIASDFAYDVWTGENPFKSWAKIVDCGDAPLTFLDNTLALKQLEQAHRRTSSRPTKSPDHPVPRIIAFGGDHTTTLPALRAAHSHFGRLSVIHFDSHLDSWDPSIFSHNISDYAGLNHGTFLHFAHEEGLLHANSSIHAGIRCPVFRPRADMREDARCGFRAIGAREVERVGVKGIIDAIRDRVKGTKMYISVDIDVLDPAFAPATGTPEVGGWSTRELLSILDGLEGLEIVGADVVEVSPSYDSPGETTALAGAEVAHTLMSLMVAKPVDPGH